MDRWHAQRQTPSTSAWKIKQAVCLVTNWKAWPLAAESKKPNARYTAVQATKHSGVVANTPYASSSAYGPLVCEKRISCNYLVTSTCTNTNTCITTAKTI